MNKLESLDLNRLLTLHWLLEDAHVSHAAAHLGTTQPAVSRSLRELRLWFRDPLLVRSGRVLSRTRLAEQLRPRLAHVIAELRELTRGAVPFEPQDARGPVRIGCTDYMAVLVLAAWDQQVAPSAPKLDLELVTPSAAHSEALERGFFDLSVLPARGRPSADGLVHEPWFEDRYVTLARADHPLAGKRVGWKRFAELEHVQVVTGLGGQSDLDRAFHAQGLERRVTVRVGTFLLAVQALRNTDRVATLPSRLLSTALTPLARLHTPLTVAPFTLDLIFHPRMEHEPRHLFVRKALLAFDGS
jgi:DNA-binding transcriptional LysR family regulator